MLLSEEMLLATSSFFFLTEYICSEFFKVLLPIKSQSVINISISVAAAQKQVLWWYNMKHQYFFFLSSQVLGNNSHAIVSNDEWLVNSAAIQLFHRSSRCLTLQGGWIAADFRVWNQAHSVPPAFNSEHSEMALTFHWSQSPSFTYKEAGVARAL